MTATHVAAQIRSAISDIKKADLEDPQLVEVLQLAEGLVDAMKVFFSSLDTTVYGEFRYIGEYIARTREEIAELRPNSIKDENIPSAGEQLDAVVKDTETATETIMSLAEGLMDDLPGADPEEYKERVDGVMMEIIEACSFQDLTGQRVNKVVKTLQHIEERISRFADVMGAVDAPSEDRRTREEKLLNGPALGGPATSQDAIDALFDGAGAGGDAGLAQDDIDSLFD